MSSTESSSSSSSSSSEPYRKRKSKSRSRRRSRSRRKHRSSRSRRSKHSRRKRSRSRSKSWSSKRSRRSASATPTYANEGQLAAALKSLIQQNVRAETAATSGTTQQFQQMVKGSLPANLKFRLFICLICCECTRETNTLHLTLEYGMQI